MKFCKKCQTNTERYASGRCKPCHLACSAARHAANPATKRAVSAAWDAANRDKVRAKSTAWYVANHERARATGAAYRAANREKCRAVTSSWAAANPEKKRSTNAAWKASNKEKLRIYKHNRRARELNAGGTLSHGLADKLFKLQRGKCACCHISIAGGNHMDHVIPLALDGPNKDWNMQLLCPPCNLSKGAKHPIDFMQSKGLLL